MTVMTNTPDIIAQAIERYIRSEFRIRDDDQSFDRDVDLYDLGFVDSAGAVELIAFVETTFGLELRDDDIFSDHFTTITGISGLVHARLTQQRSTAAGSL